MTEDATPEDIFAAIQATLRRMDEQDKLIEIMTGEIKRLKAITCGPGDYPEVMQEYPGLFDIVPRLTQTFSQHYHGHSDTGYPGIVTHTGPQLPAGGSLGPVPNE